MNIEEFVSRLPLDVTYYQILRENHKFSKYELFYNLLTSEDDENIEIVKWLIKGHAYEIFETLGTEDPFTFWGNMDIYFKDKSRALDYLWNYGNKTFQELLKEKFSYCYTKELRTFVIYNPGSFHFRGIGFNKDYTYSPLYKPEKYEIIYKDRKTSFNNFEYDYITDNIKMSHLIPIIVNLNKKEIVNQRDYRLYIIYKFTSLFIYKFLNKSIVVFGHETIYQIFTFIENNLESFKNNNELYILLDVIFYIYYHRGHRTEVFPTEMGDYYIERIDDIYRYKVEFIERMTKVYKAIGIDEKLKVPEPLKELKYEMKFNNYQVLEIKENNNEFIDPNKTLFKFAIYLYELTKRFKFYYFKDHPFLHEIFGKLFIKINHRRRWVSYSKKREYVRFNLLITEEKHQQDIDLFKEINPRLEKMFIEGTLDTRAFIPGIRLFNELYTILKIFPWIIENKKETKKDFLIGIDKHLKMLIFTNQQERDTFEYSFKNNKNFMNMTQEILNTYKKMD